MRADGRAEQFIDGVKAKEAPDEVKLARKTLFKAIVVRARVQSSI